mmetsp:Transcript_29210/g.53378  ORF Transcript_29210/g.53378 Transcript_29210/m.53378 type:complete len:566 (+) Transcript_29210:62-1759(+)|eukprot:CAMPEP_0196143454 /NCGR_PEP_ID=MMETSP0910-20130528/13389_1 /TAXON_ID=49265 /ORGANISM="Thalassiosira rotula, Strain GSO102" /LENGTH=565 /DNA_ID=CAMNT_0041404917 /DNA_START=55 /DNA_END=1752 /DNA_ORIENTATION=+
MVGIGSSMNRNSMSMALLLTTAALLLATSSAAPEHPSLIDRILPNQTLSTPYYGQHVGCAFADLNGDGAMDLIFAAGRHWVDQSYALINLGPEYVDGEDDDDNREFRGVKFSEALPIGPPGAYYQVDVSPSSSMVGSDVAGSTHRSTVLLVGGTCHVETSNDFGSCRHGENTPARVVEVSMSTHEAGGCSVHQPEAECHLEYADVWEHPNPRGDRNGGFAAFDDGQATMIALLGQGGIELFRSNIMMATSSTTDDSQQRQQVHGQNLLHTSYSSVFHRMPPTKTDPRSDFARYAGFAAGHLSSTRGVVAAGRRSDYDAPQRDDDRNIIGINELVTFDEEDDGERSFLASTLSPPVASGEPYPGDARYSIQTTNYAFADVDGDGVQDLLEATFLYQKQRRPGYPLPQRVHFLDETGNVKETLVVLEDGEGGDLEDEDAGRSVTTGQIFSDSTLPDVVFASAEGVVTVFANLGVDGESGEFLGLEQRYELSAGTNECQVRDVVVTKLAQERQSGKCWVGIVCAVTCGVEIMGKNHIFYVEGNGTACNGGDGDLTDLAEGVLLGKIVK